ncbi:hypothetical protein [Mycolicibacter minnesotensis]
MSLNLFVALVGPSGGGKGASEAAAADGFDFGLLVHFLPLGSGEGMPRTYRDADAPRSAIFSAPEVDTLGALGARQGSTLSAELRKAYSGEALGFANAGRDTRVVVPAHSYRCCLLVGVQPLRSGTLLDAADGGMPQRFVWLPVSDPDAPDERPPWPGQRKVKPPVWPDDQIDLVVPDVAVQAIRAHRLAVLRESPDIDPLAGHAMLTRLKIAAGLMAMEGRTIIDTNDWELAGYVMAVSDRTREVCQRALAGQSRRANTARALATAEREEVISDRKLHRAKQAILRRLDDGRQQTRGQLHRLLKADIRDYCDAALADLVDNNEISVSAGEYERLGGHVSQGTHDEKKASSCPDSKVSQGTRVPSARAPLAITSMPPRRRRERTRGKFQQTSNGGVA